MSEKNPLAASAWQSLTKEQKDEYKRKSKNMKEIDLNSIDDSQRSKLIRMARLQIMDQVNYHDHIKVKL